MFQPCYIDLYENGELERRFKRLESRLANCDICPRKCHVNRLGGEVGFCRSGYRPLISSVCDHHGEEPVLSGYAGSGTIFFGNCNLKCVFCQNYQISQELSKFGAKEMDCNTLAENMMYLQRMGCHNINFVSPSHYVPQIVRAVCTAVPMGLNVPLVYNTNAYDDIATLQQLDGIIDIYLPDMKYSSDIYAEKFSGAIDYVSFSRTAIKEMYRQVGDLIVNDRGVAERGLIIRHLILPNSLAGSEDSLSWLAAEVSPSVTISLMSQYRPCYRGRDIGELSRKITYNEYESVVQRMHELGIDNGWLQEMHSPEHYVPDFARKKHPFEDVR